MFLFKLTYLHLLILVYSVHGILSTIFTRATFVNVALTAVTLLAHCPSFHDSAGGGYVAHFRPCLRSGLTREWKNRGFGPWTRPSQTVQSIMGPDNRG